MAEKRNEDTRFIDWLDVMGVEAIYFRGGGEIKPRSMSLRAALRVSVPKNYAPPVEEAVRPLRRHRPSSGGKR